MHSADSGTNSVVFMVWYRTGQYSTVKHSNHRQNEGWALLDGWWCDSEWVTSGRACEWKDAQVLVQGRHATLCRRPFAIGFQPIKNVPMENSGAEVGLLRGRDRCEWLHVQWKESGLCSAESHSALLALPVVSARPRVSLTSNNTTLQPGYTVSRHIKERRDRRELFGYRAWTIRQIRSPF